MRSGIKPSGNRDGRFCLLCHCALLMYHIGMKRFIATDIMDFRELRESGKLYVDKTSYAYSLVNPDTGKFYFISRPRRYGKSLMCSTLKYIFQGRRDLFEGLYIAEKTDYDFREYPVLHFNFARFNTESFESFYSDFQMETMSLIRNAGGEIELSHPSTMLNQFLMSSKRQSVIIIDEFDAPVSDSLDDKDKLKKMQSEFSAFYSIIKNDEEKVRFLFITGVTKLSNMSIFSKMNNLNDISMDSEFSAAFGYTEAELEENFSEYIDEYLATDSCPFSSREGFLREIRDYYDGYRFSPDDEKKVYNPVSIGFFFSKGCSFRNYWQNTGVSTLAVELAEKYDLLSIVERIPSVGMEAFTSFDIASLADKNLMKSSVYALLYYTGYLTIEEGNTSGLRLRFPNKEVSSSFTASLVQRYLGRDSDMGSFIYDMKSALGEGNTEMAISILKEFYSAIPYAVLFKERREESYHLIFHSFFTAYGADATAEDMTSKGRADEVVKTRDHIYIFELKVDRDADAAIKQIKERGYWQKYLHSGRNLHLVGLDFSSETRNIREWKEEMLDRAQEGVPFSAK